MTFKKQYKIELAPTLSGHWYSVTKETPIKFKGELGKIIKGGGSKISKEKFLGYFASSTTILEAYPMSQFLVNWKVQQGATESERILQEAGKRGTNVHYGIELLIDGIELQKEGHTLDEWNRLNSFVAWYKEYKPEILATEQRVFSEKYGYAGTFDVLCKIDGKVALGDWKTSSNIYPQYWLQLASYANALEEMSDVKVEEIFICQFGAKNKNGYRYALGGKDWQEYFEVFLSVQETWAYNHNIDADFQPPILNLPDSLKL